MPAKFKFDGGVQLFWRTDLPDRIRITIQRDDRAEESRRIDFYADDTTVGQVADAIQQTLFAPTAEDPVTNDCEPKFVRLTVQGEGVYYFNPKLTPEALPALRQIVGQLERQELTTRLKQSKIQAFCQAYGGIPAGCKTYRAEAGPRGEGHFEVFGQVTYDKEVWVREAPSSEQQGTEQDQRDRAQANAGVAAACARNVAAEAWPEEGGVEDPNRKGPAHSYPEDAISPGE